MAIRLYRAALPVGRGGRFQHARPAVKGGKREVGEPEAGSYTGTRTASCDAAVNNVRLYQSATMTDVIAVAPASMNATTT